MSVSTEQLLLAVLVGLAAAFGMFALDVVVGLLIFVCDALRRPIRRSSR